MTIHTDGWIKLDSSARNFHSTRGVHLVTLHLHAAQHHFHFRRVKKQLVLQEPSTDIVGILRDWFKCHICVRLQSYIQLRIIGILIVAYRMRGYNVIDRWQIQSKRKWPQDAALRNTRYTVDYCWTSSSNTYILSTICNKGPQPVYSMTSDTKIRHKMTK